MRMDYNIWALTYDVQGLLILLRRLGGNYKMLTTIVHMALDPRRRLWIIIIIIIIVCVCERETSKHCQ